MGEASEQTELPNCVGQRRTAVADNITWDLLEGNFLTRHPKIPASETLGVRCPMPPPLVMELDQSREAPSDLWDETASLIYGCVADLGFCLAWQFELLLICHILRCNSQGFLRISAC